MTEQVETSEWKPRHKVAIVIAICAAIIGAPVAVGAATGQLVNIVDSTTSAAARVDTGGSLRTNVVAGTVTATPAVPRVPFQLTPQLTDFYQNGGQRPAISYPSTSTVAISDIVITGSHSNVERWDFALWQAPGSTIAACDENLLAGNRRRLIHLIVEPHSVISEHFTTPLVAKPTGTTPFCLIAIANSQQGTGGYIDTSISGWVQSGTFTAAPVTAAASSASAPAPGEPVLPPAAGESHG